VFNGSWGTIHALFAMTTFVAGSLAAIVSFKVLPAPMRYLSGILGAISLATLLQYFALGDSSPMLEMGEGGVERWIAYPVLVWTIAFGGFMMGTAGKH
jgi:peptidoglycan/LPS O-acetylase OafA/YrhL